MSRFAVASVLLGLLLAAGCAKPPGPKDEAPTASLPEGSLFVLTAASEYYQSGPQQGRPPDGEWPEGTRVVLLSEQGNYGLVEAEDGTQAYVTRANLKRVAPEENADVSELAKGENQFALDLFKVLRSEDEGNLFFAPLSIATALAMVDVGARGETADQIAAALHFPWQGARLNAAMADQRVGLVPQGKTPGYQLDIANRLWVQQGFELQPDYLETLSRNYGAEPGQVDFQKQAEQARQQINAWVAQHTADRITDLLPQGSIDELTRLVLANAVYFKGTWEDPFDEDRTRDAPFHVDADTEVQVPMMAAQRDFGHYGTEGLQLVELPYAGDELSMVVILPDEIDGLAALEETLDAETLGSWLEKTEWREVELYLPRFRVESAFPLNAALGSLGIEAAYDPAQADLSGISTAEKLFLSYVMHKAFVDVNEEGTEAAAATGVVAGVTSAPPPDEVPVFRADHPFVFLIRHQKTGAILMLGHLRNPKE